MQTAFFFDIKPGDQIYTPSRIYALKHARNPDPGSKFDLLTRPIRELPDEQLIGVLESEHYDMFLGYEYPGIYGHFAFTEQEDGLHVFSVFTNEEYRQKQLILWGLTTSYLEGARKIKKARRTRLSGGGDENIKILLKLLSRKEKKFGIKVDLDTCWVELYR